MIAVKDQMATGTAVGSLPKRHHVPMMTSAAILSRVGRVHFDQHSASFFRFAGEVVKKLRPCRVTDAFCQTMGVNHPVHMQVFHADHSEAIHDLPTLLMDEVLTPEGNALMNPRYCLAMRAAFRSPLRQFGVFVLHLCQRFLLRAEEARVLDRLRRRESSKGLESHINPDLLRRHRQTFRRTLHREAHVPLTCRGATDRAGFDGACDGTVIHHLETADLAETHTVVMGDA